jgi:hypothetical protein
LKSHPKFSTKNVKDQNRICPKISNIPKPIDMTIHWKAVEEVHFLMVLVRVDSAL